MPSQQMPRRGQVPVLAVVAVGGMLGSAARYGVSVWLPSPAGTFPWSTFTVNVSGCLLIGILMVLIGEACSVHRLARPFLGTGILGGYTTFSAYTVDAHALLGTGLCGALTTYSTFGYETLRLAEDGAGRCAALNAAISVVAGLGAASLGWALAATIWI
ncbi:MAG: fluoride efflux transporter FluC [Pseudonocardiaceae bacterium]